MQNAKWMSRYRGLYNEANGHRNFELLILNF
jgi:hypothetical protein